MNNFAWAEITHFRISGASQAYFGKFKGCYQRRYYCRECLYSQISLKVLGSEERLAFSSRLPLRHHIAWLGTFSVDPGIIVSFYASDHHPHTTLVIGEWVIFWPSKDSPFEVRSTSLAAILFSSHPRCKVATSNLTICMVPLITDSLLFFATRTQRDARTKHEKYGPISLARQTPPTASEGWGSGKISTHESCTWNLRFITRDVINLERRRLA